MIAQQRALVHVSNLNPSSSISTPYSLSLLSEYTHTLDSLPLDLSRNFADLRELDAVLSSSMASITAKIYALIDMIERGNTPKEERLWLLTEIAEEASRLKLGGEDKIRVASQAADNLKSHANHLRTLVELLPDFDPSTLNRKTTYPHVAPRSFMPPSGFESGRRRRANAGSLLVASAPDPSPAKRKRVVRDDDLDVGMSRSPRKDRAQEGGRSRNNARSRRTERAVSPSESLVSVTSHVPQGANNAANYHHTLSNSRASANGSSNNSRHATTNSNSKQRAVSSSTQSRGGRGHSNHTPLPADQYTAQHDHISSSHQQPNGASGVNGSGSRRNHNANGTTAANGGVSNGSAAATAARNQYAATPVSSTPSYSSRQNVVPPPTSQGHSFVPNGTAGAGGPGGVPSNAGYDPRGATDWAPLGAHQLEGPGMPVVRQQQQQPPNIQDTLDLNNNNNARGSKAAIDSADTMDADEVEDERYCYCGGVSYGEMIACDDEGCENEWFHLACIGLTTIPQGQWYCDTCSKKRNAHRPPRGGRRKNNNARSAKTS
ncbi:hypothetical protein AMATHDRAFT_65572 [Amanita thiersii Skay4041]|uniref:Chromatin modification-related protein n=1 Tax=Amanita thiersii Skay4041 TaxID=703135 RepID=A0A2A9NEC6_9AGAR|nr:hypothetical protein AMATHDRAFT_65572 [Amanita thiersii Skay4041]